MSVSVCVYVYLSVFDLRVETSKVRRCVPELGCSATKKNKYFEFKILKFLKIC